MNYSQKRGSSEMSQPFHQSFRSMLFAISKDRMNLWKVRLLCLSSLLKSWNGNSSGDLAMKLWWRIPFLFCRKKVIKRWLAMLLYLSLAPQYHTSICKHKFFLHQLWIQLMIVFEFFSCRDFLFPSNFYGYVCTQY